METREALNAQGRAGTVFIETNKMNTAVEILNGLISDNRDLINVYETAAARLENNANVKLLHNYAEQHERFVTELSNLVVRFSGKPDTSNSGGGLLKQAWVSLKAAVTEGDGPVLAEVSQAAEQILTTYSETMGANIPEEARQLIRNHISDARLAHKKLSAMSTAYSS